MKTWIGIVLAGLCWASAPVSAESLSEWSQTLNKPEVQQVILNRIFSGQVGPLANAILNKETGSYLFPKNSAWVRLGADAVYVSSTSTGGPYFIVSCMLYNRPDQEPVAATSYIFYDTAQRPTTISGGYAAHEQVKLVTLPGLNRWFLVLVDTSGQGKSTQVSAFVLAFNGLDKPKSVWNSPMSAWNFQFGFAPLGGKEENLVFRSTKNGDTQYSAYSWGGNRFDLNSAAFESRLKALPDSVWQFGSGS